MIRKRKSEKKDPDTSNEKTKSSESNQFDQQYATEIAEKVAWLFDTFRRPDRTPYTIREVEIGTNGSLNYQWLWRLANGQISSPGLQYLRLLTDFFRVDPKLWFKELDADLKSDLVGKRDEQGKLVHNELLQEVSLRASTLNLDDLRTINNIIKKFGHED